MLGWARSSFHKNCARIRYTVVVVLHLVGSTGHIVHFTASGAQNVSTLFFLIGSDRYGFDKKLTGIRYAEFMFLHLVGSAGNIGQSGASGA
jgi:hypothetical protein